jgi:hypothetical protein
LSRRDMRRVVICCRDLLVGGLVMRRSVQRGLRRRPAGAGRLIYAVKVSAGRVSVDRVTATFAAAGNVGALVHLMETDTNAAAHGRAGYVGHCGLMSGIAIASQEANMYRF